MNIEKIRMPKGKVVAGGIIASASLLAGSAGASENNGSSYVVGVETQYSGLMMPEGLTTMMYYSHYGASHSKDGAGRDNAALAEYDISVNSVAMRMTYVWPGVRLLGANVETRAALPLLDIDLALAVARPAPLPPLDLGGSKTGVGDLQFAPALLGWHHGSVHQTAGIEGYVPVGKFDRNQPVNTGRNLWQVAPLYAITWLPRNRWQVSGKLRYAINRENSDTHYKTGNEFTFEYSAGYQATPQWSFGINGYLYRQTTDDEQDGVAVGNGGNRGRVHAIGPYLAYNVSKRFSLVAKAQLEDGAHNRSEGTRLWLQARLPL